MKSIKPFIRAAAFGLVLLMPMSVAAAEKKPEKVTIAVGNQGTPWSVVGAAISQEMAKAGVKSNTELGGGLSNVVTVSNDRTNTGFTMAAVLPMAYEGEKPFPKKIDNVRGIAAMMINTVHVMVRKDAGVKSFEDLKGKSFATQPVGNVTTLAFELLLKAHGLSEKELKISRGGQDFGANQLKDRKVAGFTATTGIPSAAFIDAAQDLQKLYDLKPTAVACDMHPDYLSTKYAHSLGLPVIEVQHHHAHLASVLAENQVDGQALGLGQTARSGGCSLDTQPLLTPDW